MEKRNIEKRITEKLGLEGFEKYVYSNFDANSIESYGLSNEEIMYFSQEFILPLKKYIEDDKIMTCPTQYKKVYMAAVYYSVLDSTDSTKIDLFSKVSVFLNSKELSRPLSKYIANQIKVPIRRFTSKDVQDFIDENISTVMYQYLKYIDVYQLINLYCPYLYTDNEIEELKSKIIQCYNIDKDPNILRNIFEYFFRDVEERINSNYKSEREFDTVVEELRLANYLEINLDINRNNINENIAFFKQEIKCAIYIVNNLPKEYNLWMCNQDFVKAFSAYSNTIFFYFIVYYFYVYGKYYHYFFETLNEPHAFEKVQIDYILEMAPKLRIASYLNDEYAKYKKLYNPAARDFDFGEDEPEEEATVIYKDHLEHLSHFTEEKLTNLLDKLKENQYIEKDTRPKDWLFAFGMSGDEKPKDFKKIQWTGGSNKGISPTYFTDFIGILGYDLNKIYFDKGQVSILNSCFMTTKEPIGQKSFCREKGEFKPTVKHKKMAKLVKECGLLTE